MAQYAGTAVTVTTLDTLLPEIWAEKMQDWFREKLTAAAFFEDWTSEFSGGGDVVHIPQMVKSGTTGSAKTNNVLVTLNAPTETKIDLTINVWWEVSFLIEDKEASMVKQSYKIQEAYMKNAAYVCAEKYEQAILDLAAGFSQITGASNTTVADSDVRGAIKYLDLALVPQEDRAFFFHPKAIWGDLMALDRFTLLINTNGSDPVMKGHIGYLYGIPVIRHANIGTTTGAGLRNFLAHKSAVAHAHTILRTQANYIPEMLGTLVTADILYGVIENRDTSGVWIKCSSV